MKIELSNRKIKLLQIKLNLAKMHLSNKSKWIDNNEINMV